MRVYNSKYNEIDCNNEDAADYLYETADIFLHGSCQLFSLTLHQRFGYEALMIKEEKQMHYFCRIDLGENKIYIDVRGMTTDFNEFAAIFYPGLLNYPYDIGPQNISDDEMLNNEGDAIGYAFANEIIEKYPNFYTFP